MKVLICSSEVVPFAKTGGLADVTGALPVALEKIGLEVAVAMPAYKSINTKLEKLTEGVLTTKIGRNTLVYFIQNDHYFGREGLYGDKKGDYPDNLDRFSFFCKRLLEFIKTESFRPDIIHCNDWQTALIPVYLKTSLKDDPFYQKIKVLFTIHNLSYQGLFPKEEFPKLGIDWQYFSMEFLEFYDKINLLKGGLVFSDLINTVSPTYAREIQAAEFGCGLEGVLTKRSQDLFGVLNGLDYEVWSPDKDGLIFKRYDLESIELKAVNKKGLQKECGLKVESKVPLIGIVSRLADQKGLDIVAPGLEQIYDLGMQLVLLGTGDEKYHLLFKKLPRKFSKRISVSLKFDNVLAHKIYAGCDMFMMPSRFEPCGLGQLISLKYGTVPIVKKVGGLVDTIRDYDPRQKRGWGFVFEEHSVESMCQALKRARDVFYDRDSWQALVATAMKLDFSWQKSARGYQELYQRCLSSA
jgi:starch synthase